MGSKKAVPVMMIVNAGPKVANVENIPAKTKRLTIPGLGPIDFETGTTYIEEFRWTESGKVALNEALSLSSSFDKEAVLAACHIFRGPQNINPIGLPNLAKDRSRIKAAIWGLRETLASAYHGKTWRLSEWARRRHEKDFEQLAEIEIRLQKTLVSFRSRQGGRPKKGERPQVRLNSKNEWEYYEGANLFSENAILLFAKLFRDATKEPHDRIAYAFFQEVYGPLQGENGEEEYKKRRIKLEKKLNTRALR